MVERWIPESQEELEAAIEDGRLVEGHYLDFKRELGEGKGANIELAKDLAMFANNGGALIYGVAEPESGVYMIHSIPLDGLRERIEQVAASRCEPPLQVEVRTIHAKHDAGKGFVLVRVPASAEAPHMVEGRYYGRAGTTRTRLADAQVREIIVGRRYAIQPIYDLLGADVRRDPIPEDQRRNGHLYAVARPRYARTDLVLAHVEATSGNWSTWFHRELLAGDFRPRIGSSWSPDLGTASGVGRRANGAALYNEYMGQDRSVETLTSNPELLERHERSLLDLEVDEDGTIHLYCGRGTDFRSDGKWVVRAVVAGLPLRTVQIAKRISELTGLVGTWDFAVEINGLRSAVPSGRDIFSTAPAYSADGYRQAAAADTAEISLNPRGITDRLVGRLLRSLGVDGGVDAVLGDRM